MSIVGKHVLNGDRGGRDLDDFVAAVHNIALAGDEDVFTLRQKNSLSLSRLAGESEELQVDRRRRRRWRRQIILLRFLNRGSNRLRNVFFRTEYIATGARVFHVFAGCQQRQIKRRI